MMGKVNGKEVVLVDNSGGCVWKENGEGVVLVNNSGDVDRGR